jgi:uncharacterized membrane protein
MLYDERSDFNMKMLRLFFQRDTRSPMLALTFASLTAVALVIARMIVTRNIHYAFLIWNLFLAWLPMMFALLACDKFRSGEFRNWRFGALAGAWLLFFPNAPYIFTDVIHLLYGQYRHFWVDLTLILTCAFTGLVLGFVSLYLMQSVVRQRFGQIASWLFIAAVAGLSGFGIYLGRFLRFNSWDIVAKPLKLYHGISNWAANPMANSHTFTFPLLFATFLFLTYVMLYTLTHLPKLEMTPSGEMPRRELPNPA